MCLHMFFLWDWLKLLPFAAAIAGSLLELKLQEGRWQLFVDNQSWGAWDPATTFFVRRNDFNG